MKKSIFLFLLILSLFHVEILWAYDFCVDGIYYNVLSLDDLTVEVTRGEKKYTGTIVIPQTIIYQGRNLSVISIGESSFANTNLDSIELPEGLQSIRGGAFFQCTLHEVVLPASLTYLDREAFYNVPLENVHIGSSLQSIGAEAFAFCDILKSFVIEDGNNILNCKNDRIFNSREDYILITSFYLGRNVFFNSKNELDIFVEEFTIGKSVTEIDGRFHFTKKITSLCSEPPILPELENAAYINVEVIVPQGSLSAYQSAESWKNFWNIHEEASSPEEPNNCNMPTIDYKEGKLCISSTTPDSKCYYSINDNDIVNNNIVDGDIDLSAIYTITAYATAEGYERSPLATATLCWIDGSFETSNGIENPFASRKPVIITVANGVVSVSGLDEGCLVQSFSIGGRMIDSSIAKDGIATLNAEQCAIVKIADKSIKIVERK